MKTILLKFAGPMQSWGTSSHFETRHTDLYPSKSAVIGILAASLGYRRDDSEKIRKLNELDFAVRADQEGSILRDYHTAIKWKKDGNAERTYVTNRFYLEDAIFTVAIGNQNNQWIDKIEEALLRPYFQPFLGRRSLPLTADFFIGTRSDSPVDALRSLPWQASAWYQKKHSNHIPLYADSKLLPKEKSQFRHDRVSSFSQKEGRAFGYREESMIFIDVTASDMKETTHDIFSALGE